MFIPECTICVEQHATVILPNLMMQWVRNYPDNDGQLVSYLVAVPCSVGQSSRGQKDVKGCFLNIK